MLLTLIIFIHKYKCMFIKLVFRYKRTFRGPEQNELSENYEIPDRCCSLV